MINTQNQSSVKALIFDCFGVIISDQVGITLNTLQAKDPKKAVEVFKLLQATNEGVIRWQDFINQAAGIMALEPTELNARFTEQETKNTMLLNLIQQWRKHYKIALLSNVSTQGFWERFTSDELQPYFDVLLLSGETGLAKPEAAAYELAAEKLGVRTENCIMIDDRPEYCSGALAVGMQAICYKSLDQLVEELSQHRVAYPI